MNQILMVHTFIGKLSAVFDLDLFFKYQSHSLISISNDFSYETSNGIAADQQGFLKNRGTNLEAQVCLTLCTYRLIFSTIFNTKLLNIFTYFFLIKRLFKDHTHTQVSLYS